VLAALTTIATIIGSVIAVKLETYPFFELHPLALLPQRDLISSPGEQLPPHADAALGQQPPPCRAAGAASAAR
jgi:hypothetical protein